MALYQDDSPSTFIDLALIQLRVYGSLREDTKKPPQSFKWNTCMAHDKRFPGDWKEDSK
jgi:hypothetical protein